MKNSNMTKVFYGIIILFSGLILISSCRKASEKTAEKMIERAIGGEADVDMKNDEVNITTDDATISVSEKEKAWPKDAPKIVPEFTFGDVMSNINQNFGEGVTWTMVLENVPDDAIARYKKILEKEGFKIEMTTMIGDNGSLMASKEGIIVNLMAGEGQASLSIAREKK